MPAPSEAPPAARPGADAAPEPSLELPDAISLVPVVLAILVVVVAVWALAWLAWVP